MTRMEKFLIGCTLAFFALVISLGVFYVKEREARARAESYVQAKEEQKADNKKIADEADKRIKDRDDKADKEREQYQNQLNHIVTQVQALAALKANAPAVAAAGITTGVKPQDLTASAKKDLPDAPGYTVMTDAAFIGVSKEVAQCRADQALLGACKGDAGDLRDKLAASQANVKITEQQRDTWKKTAEGGTVAQRAEKTGFLGLCGAGGAAIGASKGSGKGAAIGALIGVVGCALTHK